MHNATPLPCQAYRHAGLMIGHGSILWVDAIFLQKFRKIHKLDAVVAQRQAGINGT